MKLGLVTYNLAPKWDLATIIKNCKAAGFEGVEFRTTHAHGVEPSLSAEQRREVKQRCADGGLTIWGLGTACEFHSPDAEVVRRQVAACGEFVKLAADIGARGVKVRPNALPKEVPVHKTLEQIGKSLAACGKVAGDLGVEVWLEVHGKESAHPPHIREMMDHCDHRAVGVCWNSNAGDVVNGSVREYFKLLAKDIKSCHINELSSAYPWRELFACLKEVGYDRFTLCEIAESADPVRLMKYYRALWLELQR
jgi:sugar phosphate isomerase/epimerase